MQVPFVDLKSQYMTIHREIDRAIKNVILEGAFIKGKYVKQFEDEFAGYCGASCCIGVGNGTDALFIALRALGIGRGDEVITAANSFIATSEAITATGARAVFADCDPVHYNIDPSDLDKKITKRTKAVIPVHLYGQPADMDPVNQIAKKHGIFVVEDAAQAHGAMYKGKRIGILGDIACFSFYPGKNLGAYGDAGAIVVNDSALALKCRMLADHGRTEKYAHVREGYNTRLDGLQAAILSVKLRFLDDWVRERNRVASYYGKNLSGSPVVIPGKMAGVGHAYHLYVVQAENRDGLIDFLKGGGVQTGIHYPIPLPFQKAYEYMGHKSGDFPVSERLADRIVSLPMYAELAEEQMDHVIEKISAFYG